MFLKLPDLQHSETFSTQNKMTFNSFITMHSVDGEAEDNENQSELFTSQVFNVILK